MVCRGTDAPAGYGVRRRTSEPSGYGVYGISPNVGVYGYSEFGYGVYGEAALGAGYFSATSMLKVTSA